MDACNRSARIFDSVGKFTSKVELRDLSARIREAITQFGFELEKELRRMDLSAERRKLGILLQTVEGGDLHETSIRSIESTLAAYRTVLDSNMPAHSRAMIRRQDTQLRALHHELCRISRAA